jgi:tetratricopeptide (TPR) repeat protein
LAVNNVNVLRNLAGYHYNCGVLNEELGQFDASMTDYERSLVLRERLARTHPDQPRFSQDVASTLGNIAVVHFKRKHFPEAAALLERAADVLEKLAKAHPENAEYKSYFLRARSNLGSTLLEMGQASAAVEVLRAAQESWEQMVREHAGVILYQRELADVEKNLAVALRKVAKLGEAAAALEKAIEILARLLDSSPGDQTILERLVDARDLQANLERDRKHPTAVAQAFKNARWRLGEINRSTLQRVLFSCSAHGCRRRDRLWNDGRRTPC